MTHKVTNVANNPAVSAASTTSGSHSTDVTKAANHTPPAQDQNRDEELTDVHCRSTTSNNAQALNIQLSNSGTTDVDGLLVKGLSHGKTMHSQSKALRAVAPYFSNKGMGWIFLHPAAHHLQSLGANFDSKASVPTVMSANWAAPLAKHFH
jgi:hypothetical protein